MKKLFFISVIAITFILAPISAVKAQVLDGIYVKEHVPARKPVPYKFLREGDVMWTKRIWRVIDLREKINQPLYYPKTKIGDRMSLIDLIIWGINTEGITPYSKDDDRFSQPITRAQIDVEFGAVERPISYVDENGNEITKNVKEEMNTSEIQQYWLKEDWFFDRQHSIMDVRIVGICPVRFSVKDSQSGEEGGEAEVRITQVFWIYFPEARRILANHEVFNENNDAERRTFDDIFFKRMFNSYIFRETNVHDDRQISRYTIGLQSLLEGETIKKRITDYEQDLWNY
jgi:gliding motility associated protien GldN